MELQSGKRGRLDDFAEKVGEVLGDDAEDRQPQRTTAASHVGN